jgi:hypothetical protein
MPKFFQQSTIEVTPPLPATHCHVSSLILNSMNAITIINANLSFLSPHHSTSTTTFISDAFPSFPSPVLRCAREENPFGLKHAHEPEKFLWTELCPIAV